MRKSSLVVLAVAALPLILFTARVVPEPALARPAVVDRIEMEEMTFTVPLSAAAELPADPREELAAKPLSRVAAKAAAPVGRGRVAAKAAAHVGRQRRERARRARRAKARVPIRAVVDPDGDGLVGAVNINTATEAQLRLLPRMGPARARAVLGLRDRRPLTRARQVMRIRGIGPKTWRLWRPHIKVRGDSTLKRLVPTPPSG